MIASSIKAEVVKANARAANDTGSPEVQVALLTDLFREILAIGLLYSLGARRPLQCIAAGGATSLDSTLPIVKQKCPPELLPVALVSGFLLTVIGPLLMVFFLTV